VKVHEMLSDHWLIQYEDHKQNAVNALGDSAQKLSYSDGAMQPHTFGNWFLLRVETGVLQLELDGSVLLVLEPGDCWLAQPHRPLAWHQNGPFSVEVWEHDSATKTMLLDLVQGFYDITVNVLNCLRRPIADPLADFKSYKDGEVIIQEGKQADSIYLLLQGKAIVMKNNKKIGTVNEDEIIGLQAMLLKQPRTASVIADGSGCVAEVHFDNFKQLIEAKPDLVMTTLESMANHLDRTNKRLTENPTWAVGF